MDPSQKRLAMEVGDHVLEHADYEGIIPEGGTGGAVVIWDKAPTNRSRGARARSSSRFAAGSSRAHSRSSVQARRRERLAPHQEEDEHAVSDWKLVPALTAKKKATLKVRTRRLSRRSRVTRTQREAPAEDEDEP